MAVEYSVEVCRTLEEKIRTADLYRPQRLCRYDVGQQLDYDITSVAGANKGSVRLIVERFIGGGFAGQVYKVKVLTIEAKDGLITGLEAGGVYAMKILIPPSRGALLFRNLLYWVGFQGPFQLQVNPEASRAGVLWQKFIRRAAKIRFGNEDAIVDVHATFVDEKLGSCGELSEWVEGRTWRLEVDDHLDYLKKWRKGNTVDLQNLGSPEYRAKKQFMADFVKLLYDIGGYEFARQYEWSTCKSQPNCLKRQNTDDNPSKGLVAVDFRAGLALLPFLPMSPGDFKLIAKGISRGSLVQFDRGSINKLQEFVNSHSDDFADMYPMLEELKQSEDAYRNSVPDITHNHVRLLYSRRLWSTILAGAITGWKVRSLIDEQFEGKLRQSKISTLLFFVIGMIPFLGKFLRCIWGQPGWRKHYQMILTRPDYLRRAVRAKIAEKLIAWHRAGRVSQEKVIKLAEHPWRFFCHLPLSLQPIPKLHRLLTNRKYAKECLTYVFVRPVKLYFNSHLREQWLRDMVSQGRKKHILSDEDAGVILSQVKERYIQRYLVSLVVHLMTVPITQIVSITHMWIWNVTHPEVSGAERAAVSMAILAIYQIIPISPGSFCRGLYTTCLAIYDRNFKDYNIALFLSYFKYVGYLAFPIQMNYHYPAMSRFMAAHWATEAVHIFPVFGERGALLEHWVFCLFYNWPLTIRRRMLKIAEIRTSMKPRYWHVGLCALLGTAIFGLVDFICLRNIGEIVSLKDIWWLVIVVPMVCGAAVTLAAGGAVLWKRIAAATICGIALGVIYTAVSAILSSAGGITIEQVAINCIWRVFIFAALSTIGALVTELKLPDPDLATEKSRGFS